MDTPLQIFAIAICCTNLPQLITAAISHSFLSQDFVVGICRSYLPRLFIECMKKAFM